MTDGEYDEFFRAVYPRLVAMGLAMSAPHPVAQELAQETMVRAYRSRDRLGQLEVPYAWCRKVMGNLLVDQHRSRTAERTAIERMSRSADPYDGVDPQQTDAAAGRQTWADMLAPLTVRQQCIATLYYADDVSVSDIADDLGMSVGSVKTTLSRIRRKVARHLRDASEHEESRA